MTQDEIIKFARQVGYSPFEALKWEQALTNFAKLVAAKEREACAKIADDAMGRLTDDAWFAARMIKQEIKARGEA
jgi:Holliday junction resolvase